MKNYIYLLLLGSFLLTACSKGLYNPKSPNYAPIVEITTAYGVMEVQLYSSTPLHRDNFVKLIKDNYYDSLLFHRVIGNFMIQGGDPMSKNASAGMMLGNDGPGYTIPAEFVDTNIHIKGSLAAARLGDNVNPKKESSGSQFYLVQGQKVSAQMLDMMSKRKGNTYTEEQKKAYMEKGGTPHLDGDYTVFGRVIKGIEVIDKIAKVSTGVNNRPVKDVWMVMRVKKG